MLRDKKGLFFTRSQIIGNNLQLTITIPRPDWKCFEVDSRAILHSISAIGVTATRKVRSVGNGKQRILTIPKDNFDVFSKGDTINIYPLEQKVAKSQSKKGDKQTNEQTPAKIHLP